MTRGAPAARTNGISVELTRSEYLLNATSPASKDLWACQYNSPQVVCPQRTGQHRKGQGRPHRARTRSPSGTSDACPRTYPPRLCARPPGYIARHRRRWGIEHRAVGAMIACLFEEGSMWSNISRTMLTCNKEEERKHLCRSHQSDWAGIRTRRPTNR